MQKALYKSQQQQNDCIFCGQEYENVFLMMNDALKAKYMENNTKYNPLNYIDSMLKIEQPNNLEELIAGCKYREFLVEDQHEQFLKRQYSIKEYDYKISTLAQYYKFHNDIPKVIEYGIQKIMGKYYDKKRQFDYKKIKKVLKQQQGLSITSVQNSNSQSSHTQILKKSRYSTLLHSMSTADKHNNQPSFSDSKVLFQMCEQINKILPSDKYDNTFHIKGAFNDDKLFDYFLQKSQKNIQKKKYHQKQQKTLKKFNLQSFMKNRESQKRQSKKDSEGIHQITIKKQKNDKFIYNTNVKIQIRNAMFYSQGKNQLQSQEIKYNINENINKKVDNRFKKKNIIASENVLSKYKSSQKIIAEVYKSSQHDLRLKNLGLNNQRLSTKNTNSQSRLKDKRRSQYRPTLSQSKKKTLSSVSSARKLLIKPQQWILNRQPIKSISTQGLRKSSSSVRKRLSSFENKTIDKKLIERRPIQAISEYGSSQMKFRYKPTILQLQQNASRNTSIKQLLKNKLKFKIQ